MSNKTLIFKSVLISLYFVFASVKGDCIPTHVAGVIYNCKEGVLSVEYQREFLIREKINLKISKSGNISGNLDVSYPTLLKFSSSTLHFQAYISPGYGFEFSANGSSQVDFNNSLKFMGNIGEINNAFLGLSNDTSFKNMQWSTSNQEPLSDLVKKIKVYYSYKRQYLRKRLSKITGKSSQMESILSVDSITDEYTGASAILTLVKKNGLTGDERQQFINTMIPSSIFEMPVRKQLQIPAVTNFYNYTYLGFLVDVDAENDKNLYKDKGYYLSALNKVDTSFKQPLKDYSKASLLSDLIESPKDFRPGRDSLYRMISQFVKTASLPEETNFLLKERGGALKNFSKSIILSGVSVPEVDLMDAAGKKINLARFQDSLIILDCWASWCAPCIAQLPYLEGLKEKFKGNKVVFIGLSLDESEMNWIKALKKLSPGGMQLYTPGGFKGDFAKKFGIYSLPRYILLKKSLIISSDAPLPDDPALTEEINEHLIM
ncbi:TlpA family protein disulfide reductase [Pedobacter miscanthi]|uniref:Thioredoxin domain-containing protein n=1 Tax=Pedobacter miscanthi TaxID=2259170 RepID=A0A366LCU7_9SPHI|nr:TlpA disulfide reductase family protein [Pedobacter miscanthi]RBQ11701.1 hypothetical protein DRW42_00005 [Pedobacter miscanthi]